MTKIEHCKIILGIALAKLPDVKPGTVEHKKLNDLITDCYNEIIK